MRVLANFVKAGCVVTVHYWNEKYIVKFEKDGLEQTYKLDALDVLDPSQIANLADQMIESIASRFSDMAKDRSDLLQALQKSEPKA